jgi:hypothetical protein
MVTHSNRDALDLDANISNNIDNIINSENLSKLPSDLWSDTILTLLACHSWNWDNSIAEKISKQMNITVKAPEWYIWAWFGKFLDLGTSKWDILTNEYNKIISKEAEFLTFKP